MRIATTCCCIRSCAAATRVRRWPPPTPSSSGTFTTSWQEHAYLQPDAGGRVRRRCRTARRRDGRPVAARRPPATRRDLRAARRPGRRALREDRRRVRRARRPLGAEPRGARGLEAAPAGRDPLEPRRVDHRAPQTPSVHDRSNVGRAGRRHDRRGRSDAAGRRRRLRVDERRSAQGCDDVCSRTVRSRRTSRSTGSRSYTNNVPSGAFRGFGSPQAHFAAESMLARVAEALGLDPLDVRRKNLYREGSVNACGSTMPAGVSAVPVLERCIEEAARRIPRGAVAAPGERRGIGFASGIKNVGYSFGFPEQCTATRPPGRARRDSRRAVRIGAADVGQGAHLILRQIAAETLWHRARRRDLDDRRQRAKRPTPDRRRHRA